MLGRAVDDDEFDRARRDLPRRLPAGLTTCALADGAMNAMPAWTGTQSLLSMWFHDELVPTVERLRPDAGTSAGSTGCGPRSAAGRKAPHLLAHLAALGLDGATCVLIGDSIDDADAAALGRCAVRALHGRLHRPQAAAARLVHCRSAGTLDRGGRA